MHLQVCAVANLATLTGDHPAERRSLSSTSGRQWGPFVSRLVCPSGVPHVADVCIRVSLGRCNTWASACPCLCVCVCPRKIGSAYAQVLAHVCVPVCERACGQVHAHGSISVFVHRVMHMGGCACVCVRQRARVRGMQIGISVCFVHAQVPLHGGGWGTGPGVLRLGMRSGLCLAA